MIDCHDHPRYEQFNLLAFIDAKRRQCVTNIPSPVAPPTGCDLAVDVIPLFAIGIVLHVAAETLRCPLAMAGSTGQLFVVLVLRVISGNRGRNLQYPACVLGMEPCSIGP